MQVTCPLHAFQPVLANAVEGDSLFCGISAGHALLVLRHVLAEVGVEDAASYWTHDLRRGHCKDLQNSNAPLQQILAAGEWRSPAFMSYMDLEQLERDAVLQAHLDESEGEAV